MHWVCSRWAFALPLLMTEEKRPGHRSRSRCRAVGPAGGEWGQGLGCGRRRAEGECRRARRSPAAMALSNDGSASCPRERRHHPHQSRQSHRPTHSRGTTVGTSDWEAGWSQAAAKWPLAGHVNGRLETTGVMWGYVPLTRPFSPTTRSADCPSRRRRDIRGNVAVLC
jgi:hypothetical protein